MLLPDPDGPTMNVQAPRGTRNETPRRASTISSPLRNDLWTSATSMMGGTRLPRGYIDALWRIASIGVIRDARQAG